MRATTAVMAALLAVVYTVAAYDQNTAIRMVYQAGVAYCPAQEIAGWDCPFCAQVPHMQHVQLANVTEWDIQAYTGYSPTENMVIVSYRGTQASNIKNWIVDLQADHTSTSYPNCNCKVHAGFYNAHKDIQAQILPQVRQLMSMYPSASVAVTGHSLGAALAVLSAAHLQSQEGIMVSYMYTFGLPRVGDTAFSEWFNRLIPSAYHVTHYHDIVPHLPPKLFGFHHVPTEVWYDVETGLQYKVCNGSGEDPSCADSVDILDFSVADHLVYLGIRIASCDGS